MRVPKKRDMKKESKNSKSSQAVNKEHDPAEESKATTVAQTGALRPIIYLPPASNFKAKTKLKQRRRNEVLHETVGIFENEGDALKQKARDN